MTLSSTSTAACRPPDAATNPTFNEAHVRATWRYLAHAGLGATEVRVISPHHDVLGIGFFDDVLMADLTSYGAPEEQPQSP